MSSLDGVRNMDSVAFYWMISTAAEIRKRWTIDEWNRFYRSNGWKLSAIESTAFAQHGVVILISLQLTGFLDECIPIEGRVCMLILQFINHPCIWINVYYPNSSVHYPGFVGEASDA